MNGVIRVHEGRLTSWLTWSRGEDGWEFHETVEADPNPMPAFRVWRWWPRG